MGRRLFLKFLLAGGAALVLGRPAVDTFRSLFLGAVPQEGGWRIYTVTSSFPDIPPDRYTLNVELPGRNQTFTLAGLKTMAETQVHNFHCVTGWSVGGVRWEGVPVRKLLQAVGGAPGAGAVSFDSADGAYTDSLTREQALSPDVLLAFSMDGAPLPREHGGPVRLVVPSMYGYKSVKWVNRLRWTGTPETGYWEQRGYPADASLPPGKRG